MRPSDSLIAEKDALRAENEISEIKDYSHHWLDSWAASGLDGGKRTTNDMYVLDIRKIARAGLLKPGCSFSWQWTRGGEKIASIGLRTETDRVVLNYRSRSDGDDWQDMNYPVYLAWSGCNYGGQRAWWLCPASGCRRRVAVLYGGKVYACRHCHKLAYQTQREQAHDRAGSRADTIRKRLGWAGRLAFSTAMAASQKGCTGRLSIACKLTMRPMSINHWQELLQGLDCRWDYETSPTFGKVQFRHQRASITPARVNQMHAGNIGDLIS